jgi:long-chain acyl-CoA synthetase
MSIRREEYQFDSFYEMIRIHGTQNGSRIALFAEDEKISYSKLLDRVNAFAGYLSSKGIQRDNRVALFVRNSPEFIITLFALSKLGAVAVPINTFLKSEELSYILNDSGVMMLIASAIYADVINKSRASELCDMIIWKGEIDNPTPLNVRFRDTLKSGLSAPEAKSSIDDLAVIIYTSGTTGKPKGAMLSYRNIFSNSIAGIERIKVNKKDRGIVFLPMFHSFTLSIGIILMIYAGGSIVIIKSLQPFSNIFRQTLKKRVTLFLGIPDVYSALTKAKLPWYFMWFNNIRVFVSGASALKEQTLIAMGQKFTRASLVEGYGLSEASPAICINPISKPKGKSVGPAMYGYSIKIVDDNMQELPRGEVGEIIASGDNIMMGYLNRPDATKETIINGWLLTGDMGYMDKDGYLFIVDRKKDLIISKGINIYPQEIEGVIDSFEGVQASAVIGIADEKSGEIPVAYIELVDGLELINEGDLRAHLKSHLANFKLPKIVYFIDELPKNATGKVLKRVLKERVSKG